MYTRPDGFIYFLSLAVAFLLFNPGEEAIGCRRTDMIRLFLTAGMVALLVYLPWTLFTWIYYGTPVPHTITAKGLTTLSVHQYFCFPDSPCLFLPM